MNQLVLRILYFEDLSVGMTETLSKTIASSDVVVGSTLRWGMMFKLVPERPDFTAYTNRLAARPALQRAEAKDKELAAV